MKPIHIFDVVPSLPEPLSGLRRLAYNLRWTWDHDSIELFRRLDSELWESSGHNPVRMLGSMDQAQLDTAAQDETVLAHVERAVSALDEYLASRATWYQRTYGKLDGLRVAYFSAEFGLTECLSIFAGGLGILAGDQPLAWHAVTPYKKPSDYVWATDANRAGVKRGKQPVWLSTVMRDYIQPMARKLGIQKKVSWHTFRHTFSSILKGNGEDVKVVQELLRHSTSRMTLDTYTQALGPDKRAAQSKVVGMIRPKERVFSVYRDADGVYV